MLLQQVFPFNCLFHSIFLHNCFCCNTPVVLYLSIIFTFFPLLEHPFSIMFFNSPVFQKINFSNIYWFWFSNSSFLSNCLFSNSFLSCLSISLSSSLKTFSSAIKCLDCFSIHKFYYIIQYIIRYYL